MKAPDPRGLRTLGRFKRRCGFSLKKRTLEKIRRGAAAKEKTELAQGGGLTASSGSEILGVRPACVKIRNRDSRGNRK